MDKVQKSAYELIQSDAVFIYSLIKIGECITFENSGNNYIMMCQPYFGVFAHGAECWCKNMHIPAPIFTGAERVFFDKLRLSHKLFEKDYNDYKEILNDKLIESDQYFKDLAGENLSYYNVGVDIFNSQFCGNTLLCAAYSPIKTIGNPNAGQYLKGMYKFAGRMAAHFNCLSLGPYEYDLKDNKIDFKDYHFYNDCPINIKTSEGLVLFSILCSINYITEFIDKLFIDEIPQKFKFAYLQYYYLCSFIDKMNDLEGTDLNIDKLLVNKEFRNCIAHYGLKGFMSDDDIVEKDLLKGLTIQAFGMDYYETKRLLYRYLNDLCEQIKEIVIE